MQPSPEENQTISRFEKLLADLTRSGVDYAVVGGVAVILNGYPRLTLDTDILISDVPENIRKLLAMLKQWGEGWARELSENDFIPQEGAIRVIEDFELDIFTRMQGHSLDYFRPRLRYFESEGTRVPYLAPADLILLKRDSWRDKDKLDVLAMREIIAREAK